MTRAPIRRVDWQADEYISGTFGQLTLEEHGLYIIALSLIYSRGGPIPYDLGYFTHACQGTHWRTVRAALDGLIAKGKLTISDDGEFLSNGRADRELWKARQRVYNAHRAAHFAGEAHTVDKAARGAQEVRKTPARRAHAQKKASNINGPREPGGAQLPTTNYHHDHKTNTDAARDPAPSQAPGRAPAKADPRLERLAALARTKFLKGEP